MSAGRSHTEIKLESTHSTLITKLRLENQCLSLRLQDERKAYTMQTRLWHRELVATQRVVGTVRGEVLDMKRIMLNGHKTLKRRWHDAQSDVVKWQNIAEQALKEKKVLGEDIRCLGEKFDIAQMSTKLWRILCVACCTSITRGKRASGNSRGSSNAGSTAVCSYCLFTCNTDWWFSSTIARAVQHAIVQQHGASNSAIAYYDKYSHTSNKISRKGK